MRPHRNPPIVNAQRRRWLGAGAAGLLVTAWPAATLATPAARVLVEVWKDPSCGCCGDWILHLQANGLAVKVNDTGNTAMRRRLGIDLK